MTPDADRRETRKVQHERRMNVHYARYAAAKIDRLERQIDERLHLLAGCRQLDEELIKRLICDDTRCPQADQAALGRSHLAVGPVLGCFAMLLER